MVGIGYRVGEEVEYIGKYWELGKRNGIERWVWWEFMFWNFFSYIYVKLFS